MKTYYGIELSEKKAAERLAEYQKQIAAFTIVRIVRQADGTVTATWEGK